MSAPTPHILFLTPQVPYPPEQGTTLRNYNILRLASRHARVHADQADDLFQFRLLLQKAHRVGAGPHGGAARISAMPVVHYAAGVVFSETLRITAGEVGSTRRPTAFRF